MTSPKGFNIVLANGVFDILHIGHVLYLEQAAKMGELWVGVTRDAFVNKGPHRPVMGQDDRVAVVRALRCVSGAFLCDGAMEAMVRMQPDIFVKGADYIGKIEQHHSDYCTLHGIEIKFTDTPIYSATKIINDRLRHG